MRGGEIHIDPFIVRYLERKALEAYRANDGLIPLDIFAVLCEYGLDAEALQDSFDVGYVPDTENFFINIECVFEDAETIVDAAIGNNIERLLDIKAACDQVGEGEFFDNGI